MKDMAVMRVYKSDGFTYQIQIQAQKSIMSRHYERSHETSPYAERGATLISPFILYTISKQEDFMQ